MLNSIFAETASFSSLFIMLLTAAVMGVLNALVFGFKNRQTRSFSLTLALLPLISSVIIFLVNDHLGVSVAVAGAFTLVRFRSVRGSGREIAAIFASMAVGLVLGMGYIGLAVMVFLAVAILTLLLTAVDFGGAREEKEIVITIPEDLEYEGIFSGVFRKFLKDVRLSSIRTKNMGTLYELTYTASFQDAARTKEFIDAVRVRNGNLPVVVREVPDTDRM